MVININMADIDLRKIQPGQKASDVSNDLSYNFNALLSEIQVLKTEINQLKSGSNIQFDGTVNSTVVVNCAPTNILAMTGESKNVDIVLKVTNNNSELTYGSSTSLSEFYVQNLNTTVKSSGDNVIGSVTMKKTTGNKIVFNVTINSSSPDSGNITFDVVVNGLSYTQVIPVTIINTNVATSRSVFVSTIFKRSNSKPSRPIGGSYDNPVPDGWSDGVPSGTDTLYTSHRRFTSDGGGNQEAYWSDPVVVRDAENEIDVCFSSCDSPKAPSKHGNQDDECWHNEGTEDDKWMAISLMENSVWGDWSILKIKGEDGSTPNHQMTIYKESSQFPYNDQPTIMTPDNFVDKADGDIKNDLGEKDTQERNKGWKSRPGELSKPENRWYFCVGQIDGESNTVIYDWSEPLELAPSGISGQTVFMSTVFKRGTSDTITTPNAQGTDFNHPVPTSEGWSDGIPTMTDDGYPVWESHRKFTSDGEYPQDNYWSTPVMMVDSSDFDCCYSSGTTLPPEPTTHGEQIDENWHNIGGPEDIWMATSYRNANTEGWTPWVITRIKGENGNEGDYMKFIYKKSPSGKPIAPNLTDPKQFVDINNHQLLKRNVGWKSSPSGEMSDWYMSCALIDGSTGKIDTTTDPNNTWTDPALVYGTKGASGDSGVSVYFDINPIVGVEDVSSKKVDTRETKSYLHAFKNGKEIPATNYTATVVNGSWTNLIDYTFVKNNGNYEFAITNFNKQGLTTNKPSNGVAMFNVDVDGVNYLVCCGWLCNWLGTFRTEIYNDCKTDIAESVHTEVSAASEVYVEKFTTIVEQNSSGFTVSATTMQSEIDTLTGQYSELSGKVGTLEVTAGKFDSYQKQVDEQGKKISEIEQTTDKIDIYVQKVDEQGEKIAGIQTQADKLELYVKTEIEGGLTRTGIDIENRSVTVTSDKFYVKNNKGETSLFIGDDGTIQNKFISASDEGISVKLKDTGINIDDGTITLNSEKTDIIGNLTLKDANQGFSIYSDNNEKISLVNKELGNLEDYDFGSNKRISTSKTIQSKNTTKVSVSFDSISLGTLNKGVSLNLHDLKVLGYFKDDPFGNEMTNTISYSYKIKCDSTEIYTKSGNITQDDFFTGFDLPAYKNSNLPQTGVYSIEVSATFTITQAKSEYRDFYHTFSGYAELANTGINKIATDGAVFASSVDNYNWFGPDKAELRQGAYRIRITEDGIYRNGIHISHDTSKDSSDGNWGDMSTTIPISICNVQDYKATNKDGLIVMSTVLGETASLLRTITLPNPMNSPSGKWFMIKNVAGNNTTINCGYLYEAIIPSNGYSKVNSVTIGAGSCIFVNDGFSWLQFNCN